MEALIKSLEGSEGGKSKNKETPQEVNGVLAVHVRTLKIIDSEISSSVVGLLQLRLEVLGHVKLFSLSSTLQDGQIVCNKLKHFMVKVPEKIDDPLNMICMELLIHSPLLPGSESVLGKATLHIHNIIHDSPMAAQCELKDSTGTTFAMVMADYVFTYGICGFGESCQIQHHVHKPEHYLHFSLFPRLPPRDSRENINGNVYRKEPFTPTEEGILFSHNVTLIMTPCLTKHPSFIPFHKHATLSVQQESTETQPAFIPRMLINEMTRLHSLHEQLKTAKDRRQKLKFLKDTVLPGGCDQSSDANIGVTARTPRLT